MNARTVFLAAALAGATALTGCGGAGSASLTPSGGGATLASQTEASISAANDVGSPLKDITSYNEATGSPLQTAARAANLVSVKALGDGTCSNGVEFFAPDKNGDANSTETLVFYDSGCTQIQSDAVRLYSQTSSSSETVQRTVNRYAPNSTSPEAVATEAVTYSNASFDQFGYPVYKSGFARTDNGQLQVGGLKTIDGDDELVVQPSTTSSATYCGDSAGFNATGNAALNETFGWAGASATGTRTVNSDGSVTWSTTRQGNTYTGPIGGLSIATGTQNTTCPISTPMFTLAGGTLKGQYTIPIQVTYLHGVLTNLSITNATLANGDTLNVQTNTSLSPGNSGFITGTIGSGTNTIATFGVDAFGDGTLTVAGSGTSYQIIDWHVVK